MGLPPTEVIDLDWKDLDFPLPYLLGRPPVMVALARGKVWGGMACILGPSSVVVSVDYGPYRRWGVFRVESPVSSGWSLALYWVSVSIHRARR